MGHSKKAFREALLEYVRLQQIDHAKAVAVHEAQAAQQKAYADTCAVKDRIMEMWKETKEGNWGIGSHYKLPDGRVAVVQSHCITIWDLKDL